MKLKRAIVFVTALLVVFASVALVGNVLHRAQDTGVSAVDQGFVPSTGQINDGG